VSETLDEMKARYLAKDLEVYGFVGAVKGLLDLSSFADPDYTIARLHTLRDAHEARMAVLNEPAKRSAPTNLTMEKTDAV